jgi:hypothetical protein
MQYDFAGSHTLARGVTSAGIGLTPSVQQVIDLIFADGSLWQFDATGGHKLPASV